MTWQATTREQRLRVVTRAILGAGLASALAVYLFSPSGEGLPSGYDVTQTKGYRHDLELYGGKANVQLDQFWRWFHTLWHGKTLAGTIVVLSVTSVLAIRLLARLADPEAELPEA